MTSRNNLESGGSVTENITWAVKKTVTRGSSLAWAEAISSYGVQYERIQTGLALACGGEDKR